MNTYRFWENWENSQYIEFCKRLSYKSIYFCIGKNRANYTYFVKRTFKFYNLRVQLKSSLYICIYRSCFFLSFSLHMHSCTMPFIYRVQKAGKSFVGCCCFSFCSLACDSHRLKHQHSPILQ